VVATRRHSILVLQGQAMSEEDWLAHLDSDSESDSDSGFGFGCDLDLDLDLGMIVVDRTRTCQTSSV
jgi:hypothetical protein